MEPEQPPAETSDDQTPPPSITTTVTTAEEQQQSTTNMPRSYECNFCKRGFTNAQALGGHMNIHRKNKSKFKHSSSSSTATPPNAATESPSPTRPRLSPTTTTTTTAANPFSLSPQGNWLSVPPQDEKKPLSLFGQHDTEVPRNIHQPENPPSPEGEVDLELRLGHVEPPPPESSSENKTTTTRKFF